MSSSNLSTIEGLQAALEAVNYVASREVAVSAFLSLRLKKPLLCEGPSGVGKTELAKALSQATGYPLIRLQCYEGLDESKALYEWEYGKQLLYIQILRDKIGGLISQAETLREAIDIVKRDEVAFFSRDFLLPRPILRALTSPTRSVLLIDEIDRSDEEFEAFLLEVLSDYQVSIPELGTLQAHQEPLVVLTSNATRELSDALRRRCLYLYLDFPDPATEERILRKKVPEISAHLAQEVTRFVSRLRKLDLKKKPSVGETLDWAATLILLNAEKLTREAIRTSLNLLIKNKEDVERVMREGV